MILSNIKSLEESRKGFGRKWKRLGLFCRREMFWLLGPDSGDATDCQVWVGWVCGELTKPTAARLGGPVSRPPPQPGQITPLSAARSAKIQVDISDFLPCDPLISVCFRHREAPGLASVPRASRCRRQPSTRDSNSIRAATWKPRLRRLGIYVLIAWDRAQHGGPQLYPERRGRGGSP